MSFFERVDIKEEVIDDDNEEPIILNSTNLGNRQNRPIPFEIVDLKLDEDLITTDSEIENPFSDDEEHENSLREINAESTKNTDSSDDGGHRSTRKTASHQTELNDECEIITNDRGTIKLILDGYTHIKNFTKDKTFYWKCTEKVPKKCRGSAVTIVKNDKHFLKKVKRQHNHKAPIENTKGFAKAYYEMKNSQNKNLGECKFIANRVGNPKLAVDGYFYNKHKDNGGKVFYWKCEKKKKQCGGYAVTLQNEDGSHSMRGPPKIHNHSPRQCNLDPSEYSKIPIYIENDEKNMDLGEKCDVINSIQGPDTLFLKGESFVESFNGENFFFWNCSDKSCKSEAKTEYINNEHYLRCLTKHNHGNVEDCIKNEEEILNDIKKPINLFKKHICENIAQKCDFTTSLKGNPKLIRSGYYYNKRRDKDEYYYWKCEKVGECNGGLMTIKRNNDHYFLKNTREHNHSNNETMLKNIGRKKKYNIKPKLRKTKLKKEPKRKETKRIEKTIIERKIVKSKEIIVDEKHEYWDIIKQYKNDDYLKESVISKSDIENGNILCEFIPSSHGNPKLCVNGYLHNKKRSKKNDEYWNCEERLSKSCFGNAISTRRDDGKHYLKDYFEHNHPVNIERKIACQILGKIREKCWTEKDTTRNIVNNELNKLPDYICTLLPKRKLIFSMAGRKRKLIVEHNWALAVERTVEDFS